MNLTKKTLLPMSLTATLLLTACGDTEEVEKEEATEETIEPSSNEEETKSITELDEQAIDSLETIMLIPENEIDQVQFPLDEKTIIDYLIKGNFIPEGYKMWTNSIKDNIYTFQIFEDMDEHIVTWDFIEVNADTGLVSSEFGDFNHVTVETEVEANESAAYRYMKQMYAATDAVANTALAKPTDGEQHEVNGLAAEALEAWRLYHEKLLETTLENVDAETAAQINASMANWENDFETYQAKREEEADGIFLYGAGFTFEFIMYQLEFTKLRCDTLLEILANTSA